MPIRKKFEVREYTDLQYQEELERVEEKLLPLIQNLKKYSMRSENWYKPRFPLRSTDEPLWRFAGRYG